MQPFFLLRHARGYDLVLAKLHHAIVLVWPIFFFITIGALCKKWRNVDKFAGESALIFFFSLSTIYNRE